VEPIFRMKQLVSTLACWLTVCLSAVAQDFARQTEVFRDEYKADFLKSENSPLKKKDLKFLRFYEADSTYRVVAAFVKTEKSEPFEMPTYSGIKKTYVQYGVLNFELHGKKQSLNVYRSLALQSVSKYRDYLFLPFKDKTNGKDSYGGGRYIDLTTKDIKENTYVLDFNRSYNPYCAYSNGYNCPIPPKVNHLDDSIEAGEKNFGREHD
jgi:uncharacterized protein